VVNAGLGYVAILTVPIAVYKVSGLFSDLFVTVFGPKAGPKRMLIAYWALTILLCGAVMMGLWTVCLFVWQTTTLLTAPYTIVCELVAFESRQTADKNPYKDAGDQYEEHVKPAQRAADFQHLR